MYTTRERVPGKTWEEKEKEILKTYKPLALKDYQLTENDENLEDFIHNFLMVYNQKYPTVSQNNRDVNQCRRGAHRSLIDIFLVSKYYFPDCTLEEVKNALYSNGENLVYQTCSTVNRRVYELKTHTNFIGWIRHGFNDVDELGFTGQQLLN